MCFLKKYLCRGAGGAGILCDFGVLKRPNPRSGLVFPIMEFVSAALAVPLSAGRFELS